MTLTTPTPMASQSGAKGVTQLSGTNPGAAKAPEVHHQLASEHHEIASKMHKEAAAHITAGDHKTASHSAMLARGHTVHATEHGDEASKQQATASTASPAAPAKK